MAMSEIEISTVKLKNVKKIVAMAMDHASREAVTSSEIGVKS